MTQHSGAAKVAVVRGIGPVTATTLLAALPELGAPSTGARLAPWSGSARLTAIPASVEVVA